MKNQKHSTLFVIALLATLAIQPTAYAACDPGNEQSYDECMAKERAAKQEEEKLTQEQDAGIQKQLDQIKSNGSPAARAAVAAYNRCRQTPGADCLSELSDIQTVTHQAQKTIDCSLAHNKQYCNSGKAYGAFSQQATQMTSAYSQAVAQQDMAGIQNQYASGSINVAEATQGAMKASVVDLDQAATRTKTIAGLGLGIASANYYAAMQAGKSMKACAANDTLCQEENKVLAQKKMLNTQAAMQALQGSVVPTMQAIQDTQSANTIRAQLRNYENWLNTNKPQPVITQYDGSYQLQPFANPTGAPNDPSNMNANVDPNALGTGVGLAPPGDLDTTGGGTVWSGGAGGGMGGGGSLAGGGMGGGLNSTARAPDAPPFIDPSAGKPTLANVDENGGTYRTGGGAGISGGRPLDMNSMLAQYLPKEGDALKPTNNFEKLGEKRSIASDPVSLLDAHVNIFDRISDTYSRKARSGDIRI